MSWARRRSRPRAKAGAARPRSRCWRRRHRGRCPIRRDGMAYYFVDFTRGAGFSNYRRLPVQPKQDLCVSFSNLPSQPRVAYILTGSQVVRFNTATMQVENAGNFPIDLSAVGAFGWLQHDKTDVWFAGLTADQTVAFAWNSQTNELRTHGESWL